MIINHKSCYCVLSIVTGDDEWSSGERAHLPPMLPSSSHMLVELRLMSILVHWFSGVSSPASNISKFQFNLKHKGSGLSVL